METKRIVRPSLYWISPKGELNTPVESLSDGELMRELLAFLNKVEESDSGRVFHPNTIGSCRVMDGSIIGSLLKEMEKRVSDTDT